MSILTTLLTTCCHNMPIVVTEFGCLQSTMPYDCRYILNEFMEMSTTTDEVSSSTTEAPTTTDMAQTTTEDEGCEDEDENCGEYEYEEDTQSSTDILNFISDEDEDSIQDGVEPAIDEVPIRLVTGMLMTPEEAGTGRQGERARSPTLMSKLLSSTLN